MHLFTALRDSIEEAVDTKRMEKSCALLYDVKTDRISSVLLVSVVFALTHEERQKFLHKT